jgi:hypothetical protein
MVKSFSFCFGSILPLCLAVEEKTKITRKGKSSTFGKQSQVASLTRVVNEKKYRLRWIVVFEFDIFGRDVLVD